LGFKKFILFPWFEIRKFYNCGVYWAYMSNFIVKNFWLTFLIGMFFGVFSGFSKKLSPYILYMLIFILFLSCLQIDLRNLFVRIKNYKLIFWLVLWILILLPLLYILLRVFLDLDVSLAILILLVMPAGMTIPFYSSLFKGDMELALVLTVITSLLCPFTIPLLIKFFLGTGFSINFLDMLTMLSLVIFIPFLVSILIRKFALVFIEKTKKYYSFLSLFVSMFLMAGAIAKIDFLEVLKGSELVYPFILLFVLAFVLHIIGFFIVRGDIKTRITSSLAIAYMNSTLAIVFAASFFSPKVLVIVTLYQIPVNIALMFSGIIFRKIN